MFTYVYKSFGHGSQIMNCPNLLNFIHTGRNDFFFLFYFTAVRRVEEWYEICKIRIHKTPRIHSRQVLQMCTP